MKLLKGNPIPEFSACDENGNIVSSNNLLGSKYILFFYPKDDTPACTKEACSMSDYYVDLLNKDYKVFGVSSDSAQKHKKFIKKYKLKIPLLVDEDKSMINSFGLWGPKQFMGRLIHGVYRTTIIVDEKGKISQVVDKVITRTHGEQILEIIESGLD